MSGLRDAEDAGHQSYHRYGRNVLERDYRSTPPIVAGGNIRVETVGCRMVTVDADDIMICAGVLLSALAFAEIYSTLKKTQRTGGSEGGVDAAEEAGERNQSSSVSET